MILLISIKEGARDLPVDWVLNTEIGFPLGFFVVMLTAAVRRFYIMGMRTRMLRQGPGMFPCVVGTRSAYFAGELVITVPEEYCVARMSGKKMQIKSSTVANMPQDGGKVIQIQRQQGDPMRIPLPAGDNATMLRANAHLRRHQIAFGYSTVYADTYTAAYNAAYSAVRTEQRNTNASITRPLINENEVEVVVMDAC